MWGLGPNGNGTQADGLNEYVFSEGVYLTNPFFAQNMNVKDLDKERFIGAMNIRWDLADALYVRGRVGVDRFDAHRTTSEAYGIRYKPLRWYY